MSFQTGVEQSGYGSDDARRLAQEASQKVRGEQRKHSALFTQSSSSGGEHGAHLGRGGLGQLRHDGEFRISARFLLAVLDHQSDGRGADLLWLHQGLQLRRPGEGRGAGRLLFAPDHVRGVVDRDLHPVLLRRLDRRLAHRGWDGDRAQRFPALDHERFASGPKAPRAGSDAK